MAEEDKSILYKLRPLINKMPAISKPEGHVHFKTKMTWTLIILITYFALTNVLLYGLGESIDIFSEYRAIMAGASGSLMHLGIGPIVTGSIIMQLFVGAKIIKLDLTDADDKAVYQGTQKILVIVMIIVEAIPQVYGYLTPDPGFVGMVGENWAKFIIIAQLCIGSYLVFLMDEVVSKWGIGSGISMFIAAGVSQAIFTGTFNWSSSQSSIQLGGRFGVPGETPSGCLPKTIYLIHHLSIGDLVGGGYESILLQEPNPLIALIGTLVIFFVVVYAESSRVELPLAHGKVRGARGRYPIRLIYASNIPVILMSALLANVNMFALLLWSNPSMRNTPFLGNKWWVGYFPEGQTKATAGGAWYVGRVNGLHEWFLPLASPDKYGEYMYGHDAWQVAVHALIYVGIMVGGSILFAKFWIATTNMGPEAVAKQIQSSGMQIPGFRRDPRVLKRVLERYIPMVTVISGAFVGLLAALADMIGTIGNTSGTGVLLTVGIIIHLYEEIGKEQMMEMHPVLRGFFGEG